MTKIWAAIDEISDSKRWCQRAMIECAPGGFSRRCMVGALRKADVFDMRAIQEAIRELFPDRWDPVVGGGLDTPLVRFNDHQDTVHADVIVVMQKAAIKRDEVLG